MSRPNYLKNLRSGKIYLFSIAVIGLFLAHAAAFAQQFTIGAYHLQSSVRSSTTQYDYTYTADLTNNGGTAEGVVGTVVSSSPNTLVMKGTVSFGTIPGNSTITSTDTFTIRQNRQYQFDPSSLSWSFGQGSGPTANAGPGQTVAVGTTVTLNGTGSTDTNGSPLTYQWTLVSPPSGSTTTITNPTSAMPTLYIDKFGNYVVQLIVNDGTLSSAPATVTISTTHTAPVANAGPGQTAPQGTVITLDGGASVDPDGNPLTYAWSFVSVPPGSSATLSTASAVQPTFTLDKFGTYVAQLIVSDAYLSSTASTVTITTSHTPPVANAGPVQSAPVGTAVTLDGSASNDANGFSLTYSWSLISGAAVLSNANTVHPSFTIDVAGSYVAQLIVNDGFNSSTPATVTISTEMLAPTANAGAAQTVGQGATVQLDGSTSTDPNGLSLTYSWVFLTVPPGSTASVSNPTAVKPTFVADKPGTYVAQLTVSDSSFSSTPATVTITVTAPTPTANAGPNQTVAVGDTVALNGAASSDPVGNALTYSWTVVSSPGSMPTLNNASTATPTFVASAAGTYSIQLVVNNGGEQ
jgi:PKD domain